MWDQGRKRLSKKRREFKTKIAQAKDLTEEKNKGERTGDLEISDKKNYSENQRILARRVQYLEIL